MRFLLFCIIGITFLVFACKKKEVTPISTSSPVNNSSVQDSIFDYEFNITVDSKSYNWHHSVPYDTTYMSTLYNNQKIGHSFFAIDSTILLYFHINSRNIGLEIGPSKFLTSHNYTLQDILNLEDVMLAIDSVGYYILKSDDHLNVTFNNSIPSTIYGVLSGTFEGKLSPLNPDNLHPGDSKIITGNFKACKL